MEQMTPTAAIKARRIGQSRNMLLKKIADAWPRMSWHKRLRFRFWLWWRFGIK